MPCGINIDENEVVSTVVRLNCKPDHLPVMHLGSPLGGYPSQALFWEPVIDKSTQARQAEEI